MSLNRVKISLKWMAMEAAKPLGGQRFMIISLFLIFFVCVLAFINEIRYETVSKFSRCALSNVLQLNDYSTNLSVANSSSSDDEIRILIGVLTLPDQYHHRHFLRIIYGTQSPAGARVDVKFVFCNLTKEEQHVLVAVEIMRYDDIIIMNCTENMNKGKTYTYFSSLPEMLKGEDRPYPPYHYVMKADDDTFFRLDKLVASLRPLPREDLYYGFVIPCHSMDPFFRYMSGMGYMVSWDLVEWISKSDIARKHTEGPEDSVFGSWLRDGRRAKNRYNAKWAMYNYPDPKDPCQHEFWPDTIAVHKVKTPERWFRTLKYFNFTSNLKPSKLYHIP